MERQTEDVEHTQYADRQRAIEESVLTELMEDVECGAISLTESEVMYYNWLTRYHQE